MALICQDLAVIIAKAEVWSVREDIERILNWAAAKDLLLVQKEDSGRVAKEGNLVKESKAARRKNK